MAGKLSPADIRHAIKLYASGKSLGEVAAAVGVRPMGIYKHLRAAGVVRSRAQSVRARGRQTRDGIRDDVVRRFNGGASVKAIAHELGIVRSTVGRCLDDVGIRPRTRSEAMLQRMADTSPDGRKALVKAAHDAVRGMKRCEQDLAERAKTKQRTLSKAGAGELEMMRQLRSAGADAIHQFALGPYNIDIMCWPVAVEIHLTATDPLKVPRCRKRIEYLLDRNVSVVYVWAPRASAIGPEVYGKIIALLNALQWKPSTPPQYRVIRGSGELAATGESKLDQLAHVPVSGRRKRTT